MPSAPLSPSVCIKIDALELYRVAHLRSPRLSIQAWVKTLCDLHGVSVHSYKHMILSLIYCRSNFTATYHVNSRSLSTYTSIYVMQSKKLCKVRSIVIHRTGDFVMLALRVPTNSRTKSHCCFRFYSRWMEMIRSSGYEDVLWMKMVYLVLAANILTPEQSTVTFI
jgi:hypothetical protein